MKVTKQNVKNELTRYFDIDSVEQIGSKQLFITKLKNGIKLLVSYYTVIGVKDAYGWHYTEEKYSPTTSKQLTQFRGKNSGHTMSRQGIECLLNELLGISHSAAEYLTSK